MDRKELNKKIGRLVHATLRLDEEMYRQIVFNVDSKSGGFVRNCDDEHANLVLLTLQNMAERRTSPKEVQQHSDQERFIARLMDHLNWRWSDTASFMMRIVKKSHTSKCTPGELSKVIRGMIAIIDQDIAHGKITMTQTELKQYRFKTRHQRRTSPMPVDDDGAERS